MKNFKEFVQVHKAMLSGDEGEWVTGDVLTDTGGTYVIIIGDQGYYADYSKEPLVDLAARNSINTLRNSGYTKIGKVEFI